MKRFLDHIGTPLRHLLSGSSLMQCSVRGVCLLFLLIVGNLAAHAYVEGEYFIQGHITYRVIDASTSSPKLAVYNVRGVSGKVIIPATVFDGIDTHFTVTQIGGAGDNDPFRWDSGITEVVLPNTITTLACYCFSYSGITSLRLPASVTTIHPRANVLLDRCYKLKEILVDAGNPKFISDDGVLYTKNHEELICVPFNKDFSSKGNCFTINSNTKKVHVDAIMETPTLKKLVVPASVVDLYMGRWPTFAYSPRQLEEIVVDAGNQTYCSIDGVVYSKDKTKLIYYPAGKKNTTFKVPDEVKTIPYGFTISWNNYLTSIDFNNVDSVGEYASSVCYKLKEIRIPKTLTRIGEAAFGTFINLEKYVVDPGNPNYCSDADGVLFNKDKTKLLFYPTARQGEYTIPSTVTYIGKMAFIYSKITNITIPAKVTTIGSEAFRNTKLTTVTFEEPSKLENLYVRAFLWCHELKTVTLPKSVKILGDAFAGCDKLETVNVPDGSELKAIWGGAFVGCDNLTNFNFLGSCKLEAIGSRVFADKQKLKEFNFPATVARIHDNAFGNTPAMEKVTFANNSAIVSFGQGAFANSGIKSIKIPTGVKSIDKDAFRRCNVLERVIVPAGCTNIHPEAFKFDSKLANIDVDPANPKYSSVQGILLSKDKSELLIFPPGKARTDFTLLPPSITKIGDFAFYEGNANFTNIVIPAKVNTIGKRAFGLNPALKTMTLLCDEMIPSAKIDQGTNTMAFDDGTVATDNAKQHITVYVRKNLLAQYKADPFWKQFTLKPSFTVKAEGATAATDEYIPTSTTTVDFLSTTADVKTFVLPKTITYNDGATTTTYKVGLIGDYAFENANANMKEVVVNADVDYIGAMAFVTKTKRVAKNTIQPVSTTISQVVFTGNTPATKLSRNYFSLGAPFSEFFRGAAGTGACTQKIYVKKSKMDGYKTAWGDYASALDYRIKGDGTSAFSITNEFGTFSREFDVDFGDVDNGGNRMFWDVAKNCPKVIAFTSGEKVGKSVIHMKSINLGEGAATDGLYVPANTGVVLRAIGGSSPTDFYYRIGEDDKWSYSGTNILKPVTVNAKDITPNEGGNTNFYVSKGKAFRVTQAQQFKDEGKLTIGVHKAYININVPAGAKLTLLFDNDETTGIEEVGADDNPTSTSDDSYYDLSGRRISNPVKGVYIHKGKKVIVK